MRREAPDSHFFAEVRDLNLAFLELVSAGRQRRHGPVFGLDVAIVDEIGRFSPAQLGEMAATPCLLAGFMAPRSGRLPQRVAESPPAGDPDWVAQAGVFAAGLLTYVWQMARRDALRCALCAGAAASVPGSEMRFADIRSLATQALQHVEARFLDCTRFWPDLVRATRDGEPEYLHLARLTAIQLATSEVGRAAAPSFAMFATRLVRPSAGVG
jgi:hypothetical protein